MGRTLHYYVLEEDIKKVTAEQYAQIQKLVNKYNTEYNWTCENVSFDYSFYPNHEYINEIKMNSREVYELYSDLSKRWGDPLRALRHLDNKKLIIVRWDSLGSFTKVGGNELNAHLVIRFVVEVSKIIPQVTIEFSDEGDALYCDVLVKNGLFMPNYKSIKEYLAFWESKNYFSGSIWDVTNKAKYYKMILEKRPGWDDPNKYIRQIDNYEAIVGSKKFKTINIDLNDDVDFKILIENFLINEYMESEKYYKDVKSFPEV